MAPETLSNPPERRVNVGDKLITVSQRLDAIERAQRIIGLLLVVDIAIQIGQFAPVITTIKSFFP